jgi:hypothetical protein
MDLNRLNLFLVLKTNGNANTLRAEGLLLPHTATSRRAEVDAGLVPTVHLRMMLQELFT